MVARIRRILLLTAHHLRLSTALHLVVHSGKNYEMSRMDRRHTRECGQNLGAVTKRNGEQRETKAGYTSARGELLCD